MREDLVLENASIGGERSQHTLLLENATALGERRQVLHSSFV